DVEPLRQHRSEPGDLHRAETRQRADPLLQVGGIRRLRPDSRRVATVVLGDDRGEVTYAFRHRARETMDGRPLGKQRNEVDLGEPSRVERAGALLENVRTGKRLRYRY